MIVTKREPIRKPLIRKRIVRMDMSQMTYYCEYCGQIMTAFKAQHHLCDALLRVYIDGKKKPVATFIDLKTAESVCAEVNSHGYKCRIETK